MYICNLYLLLLFWKIPYPLRNGWPQVLSWNRETPYSEKNCSSRLNTVTYKEKCFLNNNHSTLDHSLFLWASISLRFFVHLSVISAVCYFSVYKLIEWDTANFYFFKVNNRNTRKRCETYPVNNKYSRKLFCCLYC